MTHLEQCLVQFSSTVAYYYHCCYYYINIITSIATVIAVVELSACLEALPIS